MYCNQSLENQMTSRGKCQQIFNWPSKMASKQEGTALCITLQRPLKEPENEYACALQQSGWRRVVICKPHHCDPCLTRPMVDFSLNAGFFSGFSGFPPCSSSSFSQKLRGRKNFVVVAIKTFMSRMRMSFDALSWPLQDSGRYFREDG